MQNGRNSAIDDRVVGVAVLNNSDTGKEQAAHGQTLTHEARNRREIP